MVSFWASVLAVGAIKVVPILDSSWRYIGGGAIVFHSLKTYIFGKLIRTIEYSPDGELISVVVRSNNINRLKSKIIDNIPALYPGADLSPVDIKHLARWTPPSFSEPILANKDLKLVPDGGIVWWSRVEEIPRRGVTLEAKDRDQAKIDSAIRYVQRLRTPQDTPNANTNTTQNTTEDHIKFSKEHEDYLIDLIIDNDPGILAIYRNFHHTPEQFKYHSLRYLKRKKLIDQQLQQPQ
eukprot:TRINITY_DN617_c0_g1_i6.p1 TRINITY_DN617_c0_g1~~TRINITY_DN617_c0_g1_i6.p1  ORF type:complete len:237 (+),score=43.19 TRINITY_DN617_c0_g1_i6:206-916(+)